MEKSVGIDYLLQEIRINKISGQEEIIWQYSEIYGQGSIGYLAPCFRIERFFLRVFYDLHFSDGVDSYQGRQGTCKQAFLWS